MSEPIAPKLFPAALSREIRVQFHHVDTCPVTGRARIFFENGGGSLKLKTAIARSAEIAAIPDQEQRDNEASRYLKKILDDGLQAEIKRTILDFKQTFIAEGQLATKA